MTCKLQDARPDWKSYALGELDASARREAELIRQFHTTILRSCGHTKGEMGSYLHLPNSHSALALSLHVAGAALVGVDVLRCLD